METSNGKKDGPGTAAPTAVEGGSKSGAAEVHLRPQDAGDDGACSMEIDEDTQILGPSSHNGGTDDGDGAESSGSSAADESGGTHRSSGGYSPGAGTTSAGTTASLVASAGRVWMAEKGD